MTAAAFDKATGTHVRRYGEPGNLWEGWYSVERGTQLLGFVRDERSLNHPQGWCYLVRGRPSYGYRLRRDAVAALVAEAVRFGFADGGAR